MEKLNWGIIGLGNIANVFANAFNYSNYGKLKAIASKNKEKLKKFRNKFNIEEKYSFNSYEDLIKNSDVDIVYIALPTAFHFETVMMCINNGKRILVEKPATSNLDEALKIQKIIKDKLFFCEAMMYRFHPQIKKLLELIKNGDIGKLTSMEANFGSDILTSFNFLGFRKRKKINPKNRLFNKDLGGGVILDLGCYCVSLSTLIASQISELKEIKVLNKKKEICSSGVDINSYAELNFDNGFKSFIGASFSEPLGRKAIINGEKGQIILDDVWFGQVPFITLKTEQTQKIEINKINNIYSNEIDSISESIINNKNILDYSGVDISQTVRNMEIIENWLS